VRAAHEWYMNVVSGRARGVLPSVARAALRAASVGYVLAVRVRNRRYDHGGRPPWRAAFPVVSVGNLTTGGTGKTPLVIAIVRELLNRGWRPAVVTRGYVPGGKPGAASDEVTMLRSTVCAPVFPGADRIAGLKQAEASGCNVAVLDDGFQRRDIARDFDILTVDASRPFGYGSCLPGGLLREPVAGASRADAVVVTRVEAVAAVRVEEIENQLRRHAPRAAYARTSTDPVRLDTARGDKDAGYLRGRRIAAFCGIANPEGFRGLLERIGAEVALFRAFPDHWDFTSRELQELAEQAAEAGAELVVTTQKDAARLGVGFPEAIDGKTPDMGALPAREASRGPPEWPGAVPLAVLAIELGFGGSDRLFWKNLFEAIEDARDRLGKG